MTRRTQQQRREAKRNATPLGTCAVCLEMFRNTKDVVTLECGHTFHETCIKEWFETQFVSQSSSRKNYGCLCLRKKVGFHFLYT